MSRVSYNVKVNGKQQRITVDTNTGDEHLHETSPAPKRTLSKTQQNKIIEYGWNFTAIVIILYILWCAIVILSENITPPMAISLIPLIVGIVVGIVYAIYRKIQSAIFNWKVMGILSEDEYDEYQHILWKFRFYSDYKSAVIHNFDHSEKMVYDKVIAHFGKLTYDW